VKVTKSRVAIGAVVAAATGLAATAAVGLVTVRRWRRGPDPFRTEDFHEPAGTVHRMLPAPDGGQIHVAERGSGRPFLLIHGVTATNLTWHYQLLDLVDAGFRVVAVDVRGHGRSKAGTDGYSLVAMAEDVHAVIEAYNLHNAVAVGHSMGGMILLQLLAAHPEVVTSGAISAIALVATSASPIMGNGVPAAGAELVRALTPAAGRGHVRATAGGTRVQPPGDLAAAYTRLAFGAHASPTHVELVRAMSSAVPPDVLAELLVTLVKLDVRPALAAIKAPALVVVGSRDLLTPAWHARYLANNIPVAELVVLPGCGHMVMFERRDELARLLIDFADRTPAPAGPKAATRDQSVPSRASS
jgi:pimeloyl-ACP methyl ester carboxylesterase